LPPTTRKQTINEEIQIVHDGVIPVFKPGIAPSVLPSGCKICSGVNDGEGR